LGVRFELDQRDLVRCLGCRAVYEKPAEPNRLLHGAACPKCGELGWLALNIPVEETARATAS
jgi:hypothetical protein